MYQASIIKVRIFERLGLVKRIIWIICMLVPEDLRDQKIARSPGNKPEASGATGRAYRHEAAFQWSLNPVSTWATT